MTYQITPLVITFVINSCVAGIFCLFGWSRRLNPGGRAFAFLMLAIGVWSLSYALELAALDRAVKIFWAKAAYFGIASTGVLWLLFAAGFARKGGWFTKRRLALLAVIPAATVVLAFSNELHRLIWTDIGPGGGPGIDLYVYRHGPWFWVIVAYNYAAMIIGTVLFLTAYRYYTRLYRLQAVLVVIGALLPMTGNALYIAGLSPVPGLDLTHFGFTPSALIFSFTVFRYKIFDLRSFARDIAVEKMSDGFVVMDGSNRIIDLNPAATALFGSPGFLALGLRAEEAAVRWAEMTSVLDEANRSHLEIILGEQMYKIHSSPIEDKAGDIRGRALFIVDVTR